MSLKQSLLSGRSLLDDNKKLYRTAIFPRIFWGRFSDTVSSGSSGVSLFFEIDRDGIVVGEGHSLIDVGGERLEVG